MSMKVKRTPKNSDIMVKAEKALKIAVARTIEDHRATGDPIVVWKNGKVVKIPASRIPRSKSIGA